MSDTELAALTAIVNAETHMREASNNLKAANGMAPLYDDGSGWPTFDRLCMELNRRAIIQ